MLGFDFNEIIGPRNGHHQKPMETWEEQVVGDLAGLLHHAALAFFQEVYTDEPHSFRYGGGFEVMSPNPGTKQMDKFPYTSLFWGYRSKSLQLLGPIVAYQYHSDGLLQIDRFSQEGTFWKCDSFLAGNFLVSANSRMPNEPASNNHIAVHYLVDLDDPSGPLKTVTTFGHRYVELMRSVTGYRFEVDDEIVDRILALVSG